MAVPRLKNSFVYNLRSWGKDPKRFSFGCGGGGGGENLDKKCHVVSWDIVCSSKEEGGLGIRSLSIADRALLGK